MKGLDDTSNIIKKTVKQTIIWTVLIFIGLTLLTMKEEAPGDGISSYGFPLTFYTYFGGKCDNCYHNYGFKFLYLFADIGLIAIFTFLTIQLKNKIFGTATILLTVISFTSCGQASRQINSADLKGSWYLNKWTTYHILIFSDQTVFVDNNVDTVFTLNYSLSHDTLITWTGQSTQKFKNKIISLTKDNLILDGIQEITDARTYKRTKDTRLKK